MELFGERRSTPAEGHLSFLPSCQGSPHLLQLLPSAASPPLPREALTVQIAGLSPVKDVKTEDNLLLKYRFYYL